MTSTGFMESASPCYIFKIKKNTSDIDKYNIKNKLSSIHCTSGNVGYCRSCPSCMEISSLTKIHATYGDGENIVKLVKELYEKLMSSKSKGIIVIDNVEKMPGMLQLDICAIISDKYNKDSPSIVILCDDGDKHKLNNDIVSRSVIIQEN